MSSVGSLPSFAFPSAASAAARSGQSAGDVNRTAGDVAAKAAAAVRARQAAREVGEAEGEVGERDADGRLPWQGSERRPQDEPGEQRPPAATGDRGRLIDFSV